MAIDTLISRGQLGSKSVAFQTTLTTTGTPTALTPTTGTKFRLKGFAINAVVSTVLAGTGVSLFLMDMASGDTTFAASKVIWPLAGFAANAAAGTVARQDTNVVLIPRLSYRGQSRAYGYVSLAADNLIKLQTNATISTGVLTISGVFFYDEEI